MTLHQRLLLLACVVLATGCDVFNTHDAEGTRGRGAKAFDPYASSASGAISLSLLAFNGCAILPDGRPVSPGSLNLPDYPALCERADLADPNGPPVEPTAQLFVVPGATYFLRDFSVADAVLNQHTQFSNRDAAATWIRKQSRFKGLDWTGLTIGRDDWRAFGDSSFTRETFYENASWMVSNDDTFLLEVFDAEGGTPRASVEYSRRDFLAENHVTGHTRVSWAVLGVGRPRYPGDPEMQTAPDSTPYFLTMVKLSLAVSTNPFKSFRMPELTGTEGYIRVTWSLMKDKPFYFPITLTKEADRPATCYELDANGLPLNDKPTPCGFGLKPTAVFNKPGNGKYYMPGETVDFQVSLQDGEGHALHSRDLMPSLNEYRSDTSNGLAYFNEWMILPFRDTSSSESGFKVVGPLQDLRPVNDVFPLPYFSYPETSEPKFFVDPGLLQVIAGYADTRPPTRYGVSLPAEAKPGTYALLLKGHRYFEGERLNRLEPFFFQVGQEQRTDYPGRIGNCQICHNGVNSLNNVHHGLSVDHVEVCKTCHINETVGHMSDVIHRLHVSSRKFRQNKAECTVCHLTRESALRPSLLACNGCHVEAHGSEYFDLKFGTGPTGPAGNCAQACHASNPPPEHILPGQ